MGKDASQHLLETVNLDIEGTLDRLDIDLDKMLANVRAKAAADVGALPRRQPCCRHLHGVPRQEDRHPSTRPVQPGINFGEVGHRAERDAVAPGLDKAWFLINNSALKKTFLKTSFKIWF